MLQEGWGYTESNIAAVVEGDVRVQLVAFDVFSQRAEGEGMSVTTVHGM